MNRFFRILRGSAVALSFLLCLAMLLLWLRSYRGIADLVLRYWTDSAQTARNWAWVESRNGNIRFYYVGLQFNDHQGFVSAAPKDSGNPDFLPRLQYRTQRYTPQ